MLDLAALGDYLAERHTRDLLRIETLHFYDAASDGEEYRRWRAGEPGPNREAKRGWLNRLRADTEAGKAWRRVRVIHDPITDYERYSVEWGYPDNAANGEQVRILDLASPASTCVADEVAALGDFFVIDHARVVRSVYREGHFDHAEVIAGRLADPYLALAHVTWELSVQFARWFVS